MRNIDNTEDILDSRDVIARRDELKEEREALAQAVADAGVNLAEAEMEGEDAATIESEGKDAIQALADWDAENAEELADLEAFIAEGTSEWEYGETLIRDTHFRDYTQELAEECGDIDFRKLSWPLTCIDWDQAARELQYDYTSADFAGVAYWFRS